MEELARLSRRDFLKICTMVTATLGLPYSFVERVEAAVTASKSQLSSGLTSWSAQAVRRACLGPLIHL